MPAKRNVCFQGVPSLSTSQDSRVTRILAGSEAEHPDPLSAFSDTNVDSEKPQSLAGPALGSSESAQANYCAEETSSLSSVSSSCFDAYLRAGSLSGSNAIIDSVSLLHRGATFSSASGGQKRGVWRRNVLLLAAVGIFATVCAFVVAVDRKWNLFTGLSGMTDVVNGLGAADPSAELSNATTPLAMETTEVQRNVNLASTKVAPTPAAKAKKPTVTCTGTTTSAVLTSDPRTEDDAIPDQADYLTRKSGHFSSRRLGTPRMVARAGRTAHAPRKPPTKKYPHPHLMPPAKAECGSPLFTLCSRSRREYYYQPRGDTCSLARWPAKTGEVSLSLCNRSPNRFGTLDSCRRSCMTSVMPAQRCFDKPIFVGCSRQLVISAWWFFDGRRCQEWHFPEGQCPDPAFVFRSRTECNRKCGYRRASWKPPTSCRVPPGYACGPLQLRFPYFAEVSRKGRVRCRLGSVEGLLRVPRCLVGANRHSTLGRCRTSCLRYRQGNRTRVPWRHKDLGPQPSSWRFKERISQ